MIQKAHALCPKNDWFSHVLQSLSCYSSGLVTQLETTGVLSTE